MNRHPSFASLFPCLLALVAFDSAYATCAIDDPRTVAESFFGKHAQFSSENPSKIKGVVTPRFFDALDREYKCAQGQECAIEADPWTDAQDGRIGKPVVFTTVSNSGTDASIAMTYPFILDKTHRSEKRATLVLRRESANECWLIGDLLSPSGESLLQNVEKWHKQYGEGS